MDARVGVDPTLRPGGRGTLSADPRAEFRVAVLATDGRCLVHDDFVGCEGPLRAHHVVYQQTLRHHGLDGLLWDPRNGMAVCDRGHTRHHSGVEPIPLERVPARCLAFADEVDLAYVLSRYYDPVR